MTYKFVGGILDNKKRKDIKGIIYTVPFYCGDGRFGYQIYNKQYKDGKYTNVFEYYKEVIS